MPATLGAGKAKTGEAAPKKARASEASASAAVEIKVPASLQKDKELTKLFLLLTKSCLHCLQTGRDLCSVVFLCFLVETVHPVVEAAKTQGAEYQAGTSGKKGHGLGPPHIWVYGGILTQMVESLKEAKVDEDEEMPDQKMVEWGEQLLEEYSKASLEDKQKVIIFCKMSKCYKEEHHKLTLAFSPDEGGKNMRNFFLKGAAALGLDQKFGRAPPSHQERQLQQFIEMVTNV